MPRALTCLAVATALATAVSPAIPLHAQGFQTAPELDYVALARLADTAPVVLKVQVKKATLVEAARAPDVPVSMARLFVEAQVMNLIRGKAGVSESICYLVDIPRDARGKVPKLKKAQFLLFARPGTRPGEVQLVAKDAQVPWTPLPISRCARLSPNWSRPARHRPFAAFARLCTCAAICREKAKPRFSWRRRPVTRCRSRCCAVPASPRVGRYR